MAGNKVGATTFQQIDLEKANVEEPTEASQQPAGPSKKTWLRRVNTRIEGLAGFEARGAARVPLDERHPASLLGFLQMLLLWFSANLTINNLAVALTGPLIFELGFDDCVLCAIIGVFLGSISTAYMATWGPVSGNRTMIVMRYFMGYYPSKIATLLNIVLMEGYATIDCIIGGQVLSAVSGGTMSIAVGIVIVAVIELIIAAFGLRVFHVYERFAWLPQILALFVLVGCAGPNFNPSLQSTVTGPTLSANRLSFLSLCFYIPNSWAAAASDYYVYYPPDTPKWKTFTLTFAGLALSFWFVDLLGIGLASGVASIPAWSDANDISSGALIVAGYAPLGGFGKFCSTVIALGVIANCVPGTYSAAIGCQIMGRWGKLLPRWTWVVVLCVVQLACALAGQKQLFVIFTNFLALMAYWLMVMICIVAEEHVMFRPKLAWEHWEDSSKLPVGVAALMAFLLGWVGAVLGMYETWFVGPLASACGGADVGMWVGCVFTMVTYPPMRWCEIRVLRR